MFDEVTDDGHAKERRFGEERNVTRRETQEEYGIDERVRVIEYKDDGSIERNTFDTRNLDALEVDSQRKPHESNDYPSNHSFKISLRQDLQDLTGFTC